MHTHPDRAVSKQTVLSQPTLQGSDRPLTGGPHVHAAPTTHGGSRPSPRVTWRRAACSCLRFMSLMYQATAVMDTIASSTISRPPASGPSAQCLPSSWRAGAQGEEDEQRKGDKDKEREKGRGRDGKPETETSKQRQEMKSAGASPHC